MEQVCADCGHEESAHVFSGPMYSSSDGLPTFEGCFALGEIVPDSEEAYLKPKCGCTEFWTEDDL